MMIIHVILIVILIMIFDTKMSMITMITNGGNDDDM